MSDDVPKGSAAAAAALSVASSDLPKKLMLCCIFRCTECKNECQVLRSENRCLCGHRFKQHAHVTPPQDAVPNVDLKVTGNKCGERGCVCHKFTWVFGQGAQMLRCQCKCKHTDHNPNTGKCNEKLCSKSRAGPCKSGWAPTFVCNCNCPWTAHEQVWQLREAKALPCFEDFGDPALVKRGMEGLDDPYA